MKRVFIAGGEPLRWPPILDVIELLKHSGIEVIIATNGLPLQSVALCESLFDLEVDAVSISLDSADAKDNDRWRVNPHGTWESVVDGIRQIVSRRPPKSTTALGVYSVLHQANVSNLSRTLALVEQLEVDYHVVQPISLEPDHPLCQTLGLEPLNVQAIGRVIFDPELSRPANAMDESYLKMLLRSVEHPDDRRISGCFGGRSLFFVEPDGSVWDCPSRDRMQATSAQRHANVMSLPDISPFRSLSLAEADCVFFSVDCVNMWQLMAFDGILERRRQSVATHNVARWNDV